MVPSPGRGDLLAQALPRLAASTDVELEIIVVDTSGEGLIAAEAATTPRVRVLEAAAGTGFCAAINAAYHASVGEFVFITNDDVFVTPTYLACLVDLLQRRPQAALASGKILRYDLANATPTDLIDTTGHVISRNRRVADRGEGQRDVGQFDAEEEVFGVSGAATLARRSALESVRMDGEVLDEAFFMYLDDVDLSWRLRLGGWECWYAPAGVAYHGRTSRGTGRTSYLANLRQFYENERRKPSHVRIHSLKNQWLMLVKNEHRANVARDLLRIVGRETLVLGFHASVAPSQTATAVTSFVRALPRALRMRRVIARRGVVPAASIRRWFAKESHPSRSPDVAGQRGQRP